jgi:ATP-dependent RNA helicase RhlE
VHRIGRTGRAGAAGEAVSLVCVDEHAFLRDIEKLIRKPIRREALAGFEPDPHAKPQPIVQRGGHNPRNARGTPRAGAGRGAAQPAQQTRARGNTQPAPRAQTRAAGQAPDRETARDPRRGQPSAKRKR